VPENSKIRGYLAQVAVNTAWREDALADAFDVALAKLCVDGRGPRIGPVRRQRHARSVAVHLRAAFPTSIAPDVRIIEGALYAFEFGDSRSLWRRYADPPAAVIAEHAFRPLPVFANLELPVLESPAELAHFLECPLEQLDWFVGRPPFRPQGSLGSLLHYRFAFHPKASGGQRLIEMPKSRLKTMQTRILREILDRVPPHIAAHGFVRGRSPVTAAAIHAGEAIVIAADIADFFPGVQPGRVSGLFRALGYPPAVARCLTGLVTTATPAEVLRDLPREERPSFQVRQMFTKPHLPQGAPTSPALANLVAYRLDVRLAALARRYGLAYTRYADDLAFSGDDLSLASREKFLALLREIARAEAFVINAKKTRTMPSGGAQKLLGLTINSHVPRTEFDRLKATLTNCVRHGPDSQNRDGHADFRAHLDGRVGWVEHVNRARGGKLRAVFERIIWPQR
jgi:RNA-directed DNA polymerase